MEEELKRISFFRSFWQAEQKMKSARDRLSFLEAILSYAFDDEELPMTPTAASAYILVRPILESSRKKAANGRKSAAGRSRAEATDGASKGEANEEQSESKDEADGMQGESKDEANRMQSVSDKEKEKEEGTGEGKRKYGEYGWVMLTDGQYRRLETELGRPELERCIRYVDEAAQKTGNRNRWRDWNLVIRSCHRDGWGRKNDERNRGNGQTEHTGTAATGAKEWNIHYD